MLIALFLFFFGPRRLQPAGAAVGAGAGVPGKVTVRVEGGYSPDVLLARRGVPLQIVFDRRDEGPCTDEVVFPDFGIRRALPAHAKTVVEIVPDRAGEFPFSCGMQMLHGRIRVLP